MQDNQEMRKVYCESLIELSKKNKKICILEADLMGSSGTSEYKKTFPDRTFDVGIAEANMISIAAGLSASGKIPFCTTFSPFIARRAFDQIAVSVVYAKQNVKLVGTDPGVVASNNGGTHMSFEDIGAMRSIPTMTVFEPVDSQMLKKAMPQIVKHEGPMYIRLYRKKAETVFDENFKFNLFKAIDLSKGKDVTLVASGIMVSKAIKAREILEKEGYSVGVISVHTIKPLDEQTIIQAAKRSGAIVVCENANKIGGLCSAVCETLSENFPTPVRRVAINDELGQVGSENYLCEVYGLTVENIIKNAKEVILLKK